MIKKIIPVLACVIFAGVAYLHAAEALRVGGLDIPLIEGARSAQPQENLPAQAQAASYTTAEPLDKAVSFYVSYFEQNGYRLLGGVQKDGSFDGSLEKMFQTDLPDLRAELLAVHGIGPETADSILLYAGELPTFVVDAYTHRVLARHGWIDFEADYHQIQDYLLSSLPEDSQLYNEFHAQFVHLGKHFCKKTSPKCRECPLFKMLLQGGPLEPE